MNNELKQALEVIKKHCNQPQRKDFYERMDGLSLKQRIETIKGLLLHYVDHQTIWYSYKQIVAERIKSDPNNEKEYLEDLYDHPNYTDVNLTERQRKDCLDALHWLEQDVKACKAHLTK